MRKLTTIMIWPALTVLQVVWAADNNPSGSPQGSFKEYPGVPAFTVVSPQNQSKYFPCSNCHKFMEPNPQPRKLKAPHPELNHGKDTMWCLACHSPGSRDLLRTFLDEPVAFENAYRVCGQCHAAQLKDWSFGAHGKRAANWQGKREIYNCTRCHDPHDPAVKPRQPQPPPPVRAGLERPDRQDTEKEKLWQRYFLEGDEYRP